MPASRKSLALIVAVLLSAAPALAQSKDDGPRDPKWAAEVVAAFKPVVAKASAATVRVLSDGKPVALGTIVAPDGYVLTKFSQLGDGAVVVRLKDGRELSAKSLAAHEPFDLAMLKVEADGLPAVEWSLSRSAPVGNWVAAVADGDRPATVGVISVAARPVSAPRFGFLNPQAPSPKAGFLGVQMEPDDLGPRVVRVTPGAAAEKAGIKADDVILSVNGSPTPDPDTLSATVQRFRVGDEVTITVKRGDQRLDLKAKLGTRPPEMGGFNRGDFQNSMGSELSKRRNGFPVVLQHDGVIRPNDCGGPLVDLDGRVIGLNIARAGRVESYAVPSEALVPLLADLTAGKSTLVEGMPRPGATPYERYQAAREVLKKAETEKQAAERKVTEARRVADRALAAVEKLPMPKAVEEKK